MRPAYPAFAASRAPRAAISLALIALAACENDVNRPEPHQPAPVTVRRVEIVGVVSLELNTTRQLTARVHGSDGRLLDRAVTWSSSNEDVATVHNGVILGRKLGTSTITASVGGKSASTPVYVEPVQVQSVVVAPASASMTYGQTRYFGATLTSRDGQPIHDRIVTWSSSDTAIARVDSLGKVTARRSGRAEITASVDGWTAKAVVTVTGANVAGVWQSIVMDMRHGGWDCRVTGIELKIEQVGDSIYGEAIPGPGGAGSSCTRIPGQVQVTPVTTPMPYVGPFVGRVRDNTFEIQFEFEAWTMSGTVAAQTLFGKARYVPAGYVDLMMQEGNFHANRKP